MSQPLTFGKAVIIGLGGTGQKALLQIKKNFQDTCGGKLPPCIKLLSVDTDQPESPLHDVHGHAVEFTASEFCRLSVASVREAIRSPYVRNWWISFPKIDNTAITAGAGGIRQVGRLALFSCIDLVTSRIEKAYTEMNAYGSTEAMEKLGFRLLDQSPQVIVIGSLSGGTGGGLFFDMSILCRALGGATSKYMAFVMMPWVYRRIANTAYENTYAGLVELNHLSDLSVERPLRVRYSANLEAVLEECPFHVINLVDGQCNSQERIEKPVDLVRFIAEAVYHLTGAVGTKAHSVYDNIIALRNTVNQGSQSEWDGKPALYSTIGVSTIRYPGPEWHQHFSYERASQILMALAKELRALGAAPAGNDAASHPLVDSLIERHRFQATPTGLLAELLPAAKRGAITIENDDFETLENRQDVEQLVKQLETKAVEKADALLKTAVPAFVARLSGDFAKLLADLPEAGRTVARRAFRARVDVCNQTLTELVNATEAGQKEHAAERGRALEQVPVELKFLHRINGEFKSRSRNFARIADEQLQAALQASAARAGLEVCTALRTELEAQARDLQTAQSEGEKTIAALERLGAEYEVHAKSWMPGSHKSGNRYEFVVGVDDAETGKVYYCFQSDHPIADAESLRKELPANLQPSAASAATAAKFAADLLEWTRTRLESIRAQTALSALRATMKNAGGDENTRVLHAIKRALARSTLLLPLRAELFGRNEQFVKEHVVIGLGVPPSLPANQVARAWEADKAAIEAAVPAADRDWTQYSETTDPFTITVTRYKAIFPLHAIHGLHDLRRAYEARFLPPTHINRLDLFNLPDPLPQSDLHPRALKVLTLAMLPSFRLIWQEQSASGAGKYFAHSPELRHEFLDSYDVEARLPGLRGKFYSLVEELAKPHFSSLRAEIERLLAVKAADLEADPARLAAFLAEVEQQRLRYQAMLENMIGGLRDDFVEIEGLGSFKGQFNRNITGQYYRREADFLRRVAARLPAALANEQKRPAAERRGLVKLLLDPTAGFPI